jgi:hypothetical protein
MKNDYKVGYCKPPERTRFVKGKSGKYRTGSGRPPVPWESAPAGNPERRRR